MKNYSDFTMADMQRIEREANLMRARMMRDFGKAVGQWVRSHLHIGGQHHTA